MSLRERPKQQDKHFSGCDESKEAEQRKLVQDEKIHQGRSDDEAH